MQTAVADLVALGKLPKENESSESEVAAFELFVSAIESPVTPAEARALLSVFGDDPEDSCYGLAWTLVHLIETCGENVAESYDKSNPWVQYLSERWHRRGE